MKDYYGKNIQAIDAMRDWMSDEEFKGFLRGNVIKYLARAGKKDDELADLNKAMDYLAKLVVFVEFKRKEPIEEELGFA